MLSLRLDPPRSRRVSLTPLIDVVFILLVFFMLETTFRDEGGLQVLSALGGSSGGASTATLVELFDVETVWIDGERMTYSHFAKTATAVAAVVEVRTAPGIPLQHIVNVVDRLERQGGERIRLGRVQGFD